MNSIGAQLRNFSDEGHLISLLHVLAKVFKSFIRTWIGLNRLQTLDHPEALQVKQWLHLK